MRSWLLSPRSPHQCTQRPAGVGVFPVLAPEDRNAGRFVSHSGYYQSQHRLDHCGLNSKTQVLQSTNPVSEPGTFLWNCRGYNISPIVDITWSCNPLFTREEDDSDLLDNFIVKTCQKFIPVTSSYFGDQFITKQNSVRKGTPLLLTVAVIELSDVAFAVDSIPGVFGVTRDPFIVFTSNLFAILEVCIRGFSKRNNEIFSHRFEVFRLMSEGMSDLEYLQPSIGVVLGFIGFKMILYYFGIHVSTEASLGVVATCLSAGVLLSLLTKFK
ncbi:hypothetical protein MLD38_016056 [Melastoma candidum]|uniref:Uncharacterized protein n=1 Tax=Melastoma candidum TaxID=119954 RepID=A0ACB9RHR7_9MYRT|nr:hypothetical protein MLD38_016056 [Melastoma candidum]